MIAGATDVTMAVLYAITVMIIAVVVLSGIIIWRS